MFIQCVKHYHQWFCTAIPFKTKFGQILSDSVRIQGPSTCIQSLLSKNTTERVENVKSLGFYSRLFLVSKPHQRWRPVIDLSRINTFLHVEKFKILTPESIRTSLIPGEWVLSIDLSDTYLHIPIHPNSRKYLRICYRSQVFQFTSLDFRTSHSPQVFTVIVKEVKLMALSRGLRLHQYLDNWLIRSLGWIIKQEKSAPCNPCKTHSGEVAQTLGCDPMTQVKTCFDCKMFDVANWVACLNGENGPGGTPSHEALPVSSQGALEISSVTGQPPSLDGNHFRTPRLVAEALKRDGRCRPSSQRPQHPTLYRRLKQRLGRSLRTNLYNGSVVRRGKKPTHKMF